MLGKSIGFSQACQPVNGGAYKSPEDPSYFTDWACLSGAVSWTWWYSQFSAQSSPFSTESRRG